MNKKLKLVFGFLLVFVLSLSFVSAGLCKVIDGYYHDCDDLRYSRYSREHGYYDGYRDYDSHHYKDYKDRTDYYDYRDKRDDYYRDKRGEWCDSAWKKNYDWRCKDYKDDYYKSRYYYDKQDYQDKEEYIISIKSKYEKEHDYRSWEEEDEHYVKPVPWHYSLYKKYWK